MTGGTPADKPTMLRFRPQPPLQKILNPGPEVARFLEDTNWERELKRNQPPEGNDSRPIVVNANMEWLLTRIDMFEAAVTELDNTSPDSTDIQLTLLLQILSSDFLNLLACYPQPTWKTHAGIPACLIIQQTDLGTRFDSQTSMKNTPLFLYLVDYYLNFQTENQQYNILNLLARVQGLLTTDLSNMPLTVAIAETLRNKLRETISNQQDTLPFLSRLIFMQNLGLLYDKYFFKR